MFKDPTIRRNNLSNVPLTNTLHMLRRYLTSLILPLFEQRRNRIPEGLNLTKLLIFRNNLNRQIITFSIVRNLRQNNRTRILERNLLTNIKNSRPLRRILNNLLINIKDLIISTPMILKANNRTLLLLTLSTSMSQRRTCLVNNRTNLLRINPNPNTILMRNNLTRHRLKVHIVTNLNTRLNKFNNKINSMRIRSLLMIQRMNTLSLNQLLNSIIILRLMMRQRINRINLRTPI